MLLIASGFIMMVIPILIFFYMYNNKSPTGTDIMFGLIIPPLLAVANSGLSYIIYGVLRKI